ncbi:MAG: hypothetical protein Q8N31_22350 [Reyranella sp.]|nr:hypothetical protein [Reyranella sp.]MDP3162761.1 hypothetical protein [Reyranella sp.]
MQTNRRTTLKLLGGAALAAGVLPVLSHQAAAQDDLVVPNSLQNFKRGTIHIIHPETRSFSIIWEDLGRVKMKAADLVANFASLKVGQIVDVHWYDYMDFLIAKKTPDSVARGKAMMAKGARLQGIPDAQQRIRLWNMDGMVTKVDPATNTIFLINASGGEPDKPSPNSGEVIQMPQVVTDAGKAALRTLQPGDVITTVFSQQTAIKATIIR